MDGQLVQRLDTLSNTLEKVGGTIAGASNGLQVKLDKIADRLGETIRESSNRLAESLDKTATASEKYSGRLLFATWALVVATIVLAIVTAAHG